jgi:hypothetical protein
MSINSVNITDNLHLMRFLVRMRGARTPPPNIDDPVKKIPLFSGLLEMVVRLGIDGIHAGNPYHPAPRTLKPKQRAMPTAAQAYGLVSSRNAPTLNRSP